MSPNTTLRLDHLLLRNFRCFSECAIDLHPKLTVLVAENGCGKTALLDAMGAALSFFVDSVSGISQNAGLSRSDIRLVCGDGNTMQPSPLIKFTARGYVNSKKIQWGSTLDGTNEKSRLTTKDTKNIREIAKTMQDKAELDQAMAMFLEEDKEIETTAILPVVAFYGTGRLWSEHRLTETKKAPKIDIGRMSGYLDCLSSSSSFKGFVAWYEARVNEMENSSYKAISSAKQPIKLLAAVREATRVVLEPTGWCVLDWDKKQNGLVVEHPVNGRIPLLALSDGVRNMVALVGDLAYRCVSLNPHVGEEAAQKTPGIVLIDEVDMHLHPRWQQQVVELLRKAFPAMQMVLTTHSPHVLSTVDVESIRVIRASHGEGVLEIPQFQTRGVESADVLAAIMGVDPIPQVEQAQWLQEYRAHIEDGNCEIQKAQQLRFQLIEHFGLKHPVMLECDRLLRFQKFKIRRDHFEGKEG